MIRLTDAQLAQFRLFGFLKFPGMLDDRIDAIIEAFEAVWASRGGGHGGKRHEGKARSCIVPFIDQSEYLSSLLDDPRIEGLAASILGDDFNYVGSDGNYYVGDTGWHSDGFNRDGLQFCKIALYLDPLTASTGALRVIPGSHHLGDAFAEGLEANIYQANDKWAIAGRDIPCMALETKPGDVLVFNHRVKHASFGGSTSRRMFTLNLSQRYPDDKLDSLRGYVAAHARFWIDSVYGEPMLRTATPQRMVHLEQVLAHQDHLPALAAEARSKMAEPSRG